MRVSSKSDPETRDLGAGSLLDSWSQEAHMRLWGESGNFRGVNTGRINEQMTTVGNWGSIFLGILWGLVHLRMTSLSYGEPGGIHCVTPFLVVCFGLLYVRTDQAPPGQRNPSVREAERCGSLRIPITAAGYREAGQMCGERYGRPPCLQPHRHLLKQEKSLHQFLPVMT